MGPNVKICSRFTPDFLRDAAKALEIDLMGLAKGKRGMSEASDDG